MQKKPSSFKIGIFTVFIVVMVITMLKSVVDSAPILFVKLGQDEVGAIDFTITNNDSYLKRGPMRIYNIDPFRGQYSYPEDDPNPYDLPPGYNTDNLPQECTSATQIGIS